MCLHWFLTCLHTPGSVLTYISIFARNINLWRDLVGIFQASEICQTSNSPSCPTLSFMNEFFGTQVNWRMNSWVIPKGNMLSRFKSRNDSLLWQSCKKKKNAWIHEKQKCLRKKEQANAKEKEVSLEEKKNILLGLNQKGKSLLKFLNPCDPMFILP